MIVAAVLGAWLGAGVVAGWPRRRVQIGMGVVLPILAFAMLLSSSQLGSLPGGGTLLGLTGARLAVAVTTNFVLGALMTIGLGLYAPCMILVSLCGMNPTTAFPIMMGSCAFLMPIASARFVRARCFDRRATVGLFAWRHSGSPDRRLHREDAATRCRAMARRHRRALHRRQSVAHRISRTRQRGDTRRPETGSRLTALLDIYLLLTIAMRHVIPLSHRFASLLGAVVTLGTSSAAGQARQPGAAARDTTLARRATRSAPPSATRCVPARAIFCRSSRRRRLSRIIRFASTARHSATRRPPACCRSATTPPVSIEGGMFFVAYNKDGVGDSNSRPLSFIFNGGPGSATVWLHMGAFGPKKVRLNPDGTNPPPPYAYEDNQSTLLDQTDLVFLDPVGTGFSRAARPELGPEILGARRRHSRRRRVRTPVPHALRPLGLTEVRCWRELRDNARRAPQRLPRRSRHRAQRRRADFDSAQLRRVGDGRWE